MEKHWDDFKKSHFFRALEYQAKHGILDINSLQMAFRAGHAYGTHGLESAVRKMNVSEYEAWCIPNQGPPTVDQIITAHNEDSIRGIAH